MPSTHFFSWGGRGETPTPPDPPEDLLFTEVNANGYSVASPTDQPTVSPFIIEKPFQATRQGFTNNGASTTLTETMQATALMRKPYPDVGEADPNNAFVSDIIYSTDTIAGVTNNSTSTSPKPIVRFTGLTQIIVGDEITLSAMALHRNARNGQQVASMRFTISSLNASFSDIDVYVNTSTLSNYNGWYYQVDHFETPQIDIAALPDKTAFKVRVRGYPWVGASTSIFDSDAITQHWKCTSQYFYKDTSKYYNPPIAVINATTGTSSGVISTNLATATASPFQTYAQARAALAGATYASLTGQVPDGAIVFYQTIPVASTTPFNSAVGTTLGFAHTVGIHPDVDPAIVPFQTIAGNVNMTAPTTPGLTASVVHFQNIVFGATNENGLQANTGSVTDVRFINCNGGYSTPILSLLGQRIRNVTFWGGQYKVVGTFNARAAGETRFMGIDAEYNHADPDAHGDGGFDVGCLMGSRFRGFNNGKLVSERFGGDRVQGYFCAFYDAYGQNVLGSFSATSGTDADIGIANVLVEINAINTGIRAMKFSSDGMTTNITNLIRHNITIAQPGETAGGDNSLYDETSSVARTHHLGSLVNCIVGATPYKGGGNASPPVTGRTGNIWVGGAVGDRGTFRSGQTSYMKWYKGVNSWDNPSTAFVDPGFKDNKCPIYPAAGPTAGMGDYRLLSSSPCINAGGQAVLRHTLDGQPRTISADTIGAFGVTT